MFLKMGGIYFFHKCDQLNSFRQSFKRVAYYLFNSVKMANPEMVQQVGTSSRNTK